MSIHCGIQLRHQPESRHASARPRVLYVINSFDRGGAEAGLIALVRGGLFVNCELSVVALVRGSGGLESQLEALGCVPEILLDRPRMHTGDIPALFANLRRLISLERPDVLIASLPQANLLARLCVFLQRRTLLISFEHNTHLAKRIYEWGFRLTSHRVNWMFADAATTLEKAGERLYRRVPEKGTVVPLVSFDEPAHRTTAPRNADAQFRIVNAARFTAVKNQSALIEAIAILHRNYPQVRLTLYGDGPQRAACQALACRLGVASIIEFPGFVADWSRRPADLFVLASRHEGLCIVALQAMHAGIPVVAPIVGGLSDYGSPAVLQPLAAVDAPTIAAAVEAAIGKKYNIALQVERAAEMVDRRFGAEAVRRTYAGINEFLIRESSAHLVRNAGAARRGAVRSV